MQIRLENNPDNNNQDTDYTLYKEYALKNINNPNIDKKHNSILHKAILEKSDRLLELLLDPGIASCIDFSFKNKNNVTALQLAIINKLPSAVEAILNCSAFINSMKAKINDPNIYSQPLILEAVNYDLPINIIKLLIELGADVNLSGNLLLTESAHHKTTDLLKQSGYLNSNLKNKKITPLEAAIVRKNIEVAKFLINLPSIQFKKEKSPYNFLHFAISTNPDDPEMTQVFTDFLKKNQKSIETEHETLTKYDKVLENTLRIVSEKIQLGQSFAEQGQEWIKKGEEEKGQTLARTGEAIIADNVNVLKKAEKNGIEFHKEKSTLIKKIQKTIDDFIECLQEPDCNDNTPLHLAAEKADLRIVKLLLDTHAVNCCLTKKNSCQKDPFSLFISRGDMNEEILSLLYGQQFQDKEDSSIMHRAVMLKNYHAVSALSLTKNIRFLDLPDSTRKTPLFYAVQHQDYKMIALLISLGSNLELCAFSDFKKLKVTDFLLKVMQKNLSEVTKQLENNKELIREIDAKGNTALHYAVYTQDMAMSKYLRLNNANPRTKNSDGISPLSFANEIGMSLELLKKSKWIAADPVEKQVSVAASPLAAEPKESLPNILKEEKTEEVTEDSLIGKKIIASTDTETMTENPKTKTPTVKKVKKVKKNKKIKKNTELQSGYFDIISKSTDTKDTSIHIDDPNKQESLPKPEETAALEKISTSTIEQKIEEKLEQKPQEKLAIEEININTQKPFYALEDPKEISFHRRSFSTIPLFPLDGVKATVSNASKKVACLNQHRRLRTKSFVPTLTNAWNEADIELSEIPFSEWGIKPSTELHPYIQCLIQIAKKNKETKINMIGSAPLHLLMGNSLLVPNDTDFSISCSKEKEAEFLIELEKLKATCVAKIIKHQKQDKYSYEIIFKDKIKMDLVFTQENTKKNILSRDTSITAILLDLIDDTIVCLWEQLSDLLKGVIRQLSTDSYEEDFFRVFRTINLYLKIRSAHYQINIEEIKAINVEKIREKYQNKQDFIYNTVKHLVKLFNRWDVKEVVDLLNDLDLLNKIQLTSNDSLFDFIFLELQKIDRRNESERKIYPHLHHFGYNNLEALKKKKLDLSINFSKSSVDEIIGRIERIDEEIDDKNKDKLLIREKLIYQLCYHLMSTKTNSLTNVDHCARKPFDTTRSHKTDFMS